MRTRERAIFRKYLERRGLKLTAERQAVYDELFARHEHLEADEILVRLRGKGKKISRATIYRHLAPPRREPPRRPGPLGPMPDAALLQAIRAVLAASPFHGEGHRKVWARLRVSGLRTSKRRVLRLMAENNLLAPSRVGVPRGPRAHDGTIIPERVDTMWGTDLTTTLTGEGQVAVFVAVDHCSAECVGIHAARRATRFEALEPIRQGVRRCFGGFAQVQKFRSNLTV